MTDTYLIRYFKFTLVVNTTIMCLASLCDAVFSIPCKTRDRCL